MTRPSVALRRAVIERAGNRCEYCLVHQDDAAVGHQVDHVIAEKHGGETTLENLALSCLICNRRKASDIAALDPETGGLSPLFHPRREKWAEHFRLDRTQIVGLSVVGRATAEFLQLNSPERMLEREEWIKSGRFALE